VKQKCSKQQLAVFFENLVEIFLKNLSSWEEPWAGFLGEEIGWEGWRRVYWWHMTFLYSNLLMLEFT
jgi:hypothetical protein